MAILQINQHLEKLKAEYEQYAEKDSTTFEEQLNGHPLYELANKASSCNELRVFLSENVKLVNPDLEQNEATKQYILNFDDNAIINGCIKILDAYFRGLVGLSNKSAPNNLGSIEVMGNAVNPNTYYGRVFKAAMINDKGVPKSNDLLSALDDYSHELRFAFPNWGIDDFIAEKAKFQKGITSLAGEPGFFYFKVFFNFDTQFGLLGQILNYDADKVLYSSTALRYLLTSNKLYRPEHMEDRIVALYKFVNMLSFISSESPWFFKSVSGLDEAAKLDLEKITEDSKELQLEFAEDSVDMRLNTLVELYRLMCFDVVNQKEILPENLRKFDMSVMVFHTPLKYYQTAIKSMSLKMPLGYKQVIDPMVDDTVKINSKENDLKITDDPKDKNQKTKGEDQFSMWANSFSFKMFTFHNCEFDMNSLGALTSELKNENAQNIGGTKIKIKYTRCYIHTMNEWLNMMFGPDGFYYNDVGEKYLSKQFFMKLRNRKNTDNALQTLDNVDDFRGFVGYDGEEFNREAFVNRATSSYKTSNALNTKSSDLDNLYLLAEKLDSKAPQARRLGALAKLRSNKGYYNSTASQYKELVDATEMMITDNFRQLDKNIGIGNLYNDPNYNIPYTSPDSAYFKEKLHKLNKGRFYVPGEVQVNSNQAFGNKFGLWWNNVANMNINDLKFNGQHETLYKVNPNDYSEYDKHKPPTVDVLIHGSYNYGFTKYKAQKLRLGKNLGNLYEDSNQGFSESKGIFDRSNWGNHLPSDGINNVTNPKSQYFINKVRQLRQGQFQGNLYNDGDIIFDYSDAGDLGPGNKESQYFKNKMKDLHTHDPHKFTDTK